MSSRKTVGGVHLSIRGTIYHLFMIALSVIMVAPLIWMLSTALKDASQVYAFPPVWLPHPLLWSNFRKAAEAAPFVAFFLNSAQVAILVTAGTVAFSALAAYAFARLRFPGKGIVFGILLATLMIPYTVRVIPLYAMFKGFGWINTHTPLIIPPILSDIFGVFLLRQFFMTLPFELDEAARMDGCSSFGIFWRIILPLAKPALATLALFTFRTSWNQFLPPLIFINSPIKQLITVGLTIFQGEFQTQWNLMMAGAVVAVLPVLVLFAAAQKYFIRGIALSGIKG